MSYMGIVSLSKASKDLNLSINEICSFLAKKGIKVKPSPNTQIKLVHYYLLEAEYNSLPEPDFLNKSKVLDTLLYGGLIVQSKINIWEEITLSAKKRLNETTLAVIFSNLDEESVNKIVFILLLNFASKKTYSDIIDKKINFEPQIAQELGRFENPTLLKDLETIWENEIFSTRVSYLMKNKGADAHIMHVIEPFLIIDPYQTNASGRKRKRY